MAVKQKYIDEYFNEGENKGKNYIFEKRNDGTARNMIGIASGYALKIQNIQEWKENKATALLRSYLRCRGDESHRCP